MRNTKDWLYQFSYRFVAGLVALGLFGLSSLFEIRTEYTILARAVSYEVNMKGTNILASAINPTDFVGDPILINHDSGSVTNVQGHIIDAMRTHSGFLIKAVLLPSRDISDMLDKGLITDVSVGFVGSLIGNEWIWVDPHEVSLVSIGADRNAKILKIDKKYRIMLK